jgi:hypothetical protein
MTSLRLSQKNLMITKCPKDLSFVFSELMQEAKYGKFVMPQRDLKSFKNIDFGMGVPTSKVSHCKSQLWNNWANATFFLIGGFVMFINGLFAW